MKATVRKRKRQRRRYALRAKQVPKPILRFSTADLIADLSRPSLWSEAFAEALAESQSQ